MSTNQQQRRPTKYSHKSFAITCVAIFVHEGLKKGTNKAQFCFQATDHSGTDMFFWSNSSFHTFNLTINIYCIASMVISAVLPLQLIVSRHKRHFKMFPRTGLCRFMLHHDNQVLFYLYGYNTRQKGRFKKK